MKNKFASWLNNENTIAISSCGDFEVMKGLCKKVGINGMLNLFWKKPVRSREANYYDLIELAKHNNSLIDKRTVLIEYQLGKGITFGYSSYQDSEMWYGLKPYSVLEVVESFKEGI